MSIEAGSLYILTGIIYIITFTYLILKRKNSFVQHITLLGSFIAITIFIQYWIFPIETGILDNIFKEYKIHKSDLVPFKQLLSVFTGNGAVYTEGIVVNLGLPIVLAYCISIIKHNKRPLLGIIITGIALISINVLGIFRYYFWSLDTSGFDSAYLLFNVIGLCVGYWLFNLTYRMQELLKE